MLIEITYNVTDVYMSTTETPVYVEISFEQPGGGAAVWGSITGTLSNQTDLQNALNAKVPYSGAASDVSLGEYGINLGNVVYDTTPTGIPTEQGATYWDADAETVALIMNGTIQKIGEDTFYHVRNTTGSTIPKGTAVRFSGTTGNSGRLLIAPMLANGTYPSQYYMGITSEDLVNNADGKVYHFGKMRGVNTSAFADGDVLYVSPSVAGALTATAPVAPNNIIVAAAVVHAANNGTLMIRTTLGSNINADEGVLLTTPTSNQGLFYDSGLWVNKSITTALGYTPANAATTLTINGVTYDLSTSRTWTIAAGISGTIATGQVAFATAANTIGGSNNLFWDNANSALAIGGTTIDANIALQINSAKGIRISGTGGGFGYSIVRGSETTGIANTGSSSVISSTNTLAFNTGGSEAFRVASNRNISIGTISDLGVRLGVVGDTLLRGSGATSATTALTVQNSDSTAILSVRNDRYAIYGTGALPSGIYLGSSLKIYQTNNTTTENQVNQDGYFIGSTGSTNSTYSKLWLGFTPATGFNSTSGNPRIVTIQGSFIPTSGTATVAALALEPTINQTGGANGITRGLFVNPTLTAAADWRSIEWSNNTGWGLRGEGTANNYLAGSLGIGTTSLAGVNLYVNKNIVNRTGGNGFGTVSEGIIQSNVNNLALLYQSFVSTQSTNFALTNIRHYSTESVTTFPNVTAGGSVTNQYGYWADSTLTGATNNFGFYGNIASGTNRWNLYMNGTANNYMSGNLAIGTISVTNWLNIAASTTAKAHMNLVAGSTPTAPANGDIWFDGTDIKMRIGGVTKTFTLV